MSQGKIVGFALIAVFLRSTPSFLAGARSRKELAVLDGQRASLRGVAGHASTTSELEDAQPPLGASSTCTLAGGVTASLAALALVASQRVHRRSRSNVGRKPGRIIDALFGKGTLDRMLPNFSGGAKDSAEKPAATPAPAPATSPSPTASKQGGARLEASLKRQETQTVAIEKMMGELQTLMVSKVEEEQRINAELREDMDGLRAQIAVVQESYSNACDQLEMTSMELDGRLAKATKDLTEERDAAENRTVDAAQRQKELEKQVENIEAERKRIYDQRDVIVGEVRNLGNIVVQRSQERADLQETKAQQEAQKADLESQIAGTEAEQASLSQQLAASTTESSLLEAQASDAAEQTALLLDQRKVITGEVANLTSKVVNLDSEKSRLNAEIAQLNAENEEFGKTVASLQGDKASLEGKIASEKQTAGHLEKKKASVEEEISLLMEQRKLIAKEVASITSKVVNNENEKRALRDQIASSQLQESQLTESISGLEGSKVGLEQQLRESQTSVAGYEKEIETVSGQISTLKNQRKVVVGEVAKLTEKVVESGQYKADLLQQVSSRDHTLSMLEDRISTLQGQNDGLKGKIEAGKAANADLVKKQEEAEKAVEQGLQMRAMISKEVGRLTDKVSEANFKKGELEESIFMQEGEKAELEGEVATLANETGYLSKSVKDMATERDRLVKRVLHMAEDNKKLEECVVLGTEEKQELAQKLAEARSKQKELDAKLQLRQERFEMQLRDGTEPNAVEGKLNAAGVSAQVSQVEDKLRNELLSSSQENQRLMTELREMIGKLDQLQMLQPA